MSGIPWSADHKDKLKKLAEVDCTIEEVLRVFPSRSRGSIFSQAKSMGLSFAGPQPKINEEEFKKLTKGK
ncbi:MAG: hypothetical protein ABFD76_17090 [Smithella sp.]